MPTTLGTMFKSFADRLTPEPKFEERQYSLYLQKYTVELQNGEERTVYAHGHHTDKGQLNLHIALHPRPSRFCNNYGVFSWTVVIVRSFSAQGVAEFKRTQAGVSEWKCKLHTKHGAPSEIKFGDAERSEILRNPSYTDEQMRTWDKNMDQLKRMGGRYVDRAE